MAEHRVPMLGAALSRASLRRRTDPEHSADPQVRHLITALAAVDVAPPPRADFRAELRAQLVAVTPRLVAEGEPSVAGSPGRRGTADPAATQPVDRGAARSGFRFAKPLIATACVLTALVVLLGGAVWLSQRALPGDALYALKRASETTEYNLTGGTVDKAKLKLEFASRRINEVGELLPRAGALSAGIGSIADTGALNADTAKLVTDALASANDDVQSASTTLTTAAVRGKSTAPLDVMSNWAPDELTTMQKVVASIRDAGIKRSALTTWTLINDASIRATALHPQVGCANLVNLADKDALGPKPATGTCSGTRLPGQPSGPVTGRSPTSPTTAPTTTAPTTTAPGRPVSSRAGGSTPAGGSTRAGGTATTPPAGSSPPLTLPTTPAIPGLPSPSGIASLPLSSARVPISIDSCGVHASLGHGGIGVGSC